MAQTSEISFESIESAQAYISLLCQALDDASHMIAKEMSAESTSLGSRHLDALHLVDYKLHSLHEHLLVSRRLLGDLRKLRRYLFSEPAPERETVHATETSCS